MHALRALRWFCPLTVAIVGVVMVGVTACGTGAQVTRPLPPPTAVSCGDAAQLRQRAVDDRRQSAQTRSDQEKIYIGNRASFFASLAIVAELKCKVTLVQADEALKPAFEAARKAHETRSMYERAKQWGEANFMATQAIALLIQQLPAPPSR
jgi:hypothetical protein